MKAGDLFSKKAFTPSAKSFGRPRASRYSRLQKAMLKINLFRIKPQDKIILISDALPLARSNLSEIYFADEEVFYDGERATSKSGTIAGSAKLLPDIIKILGEKGYFKPQFIENVYRYHGLTTEKFIEIDNEFNISGVKG